MVKFMVQPLKEKETLRPRINKAGSLLDRKQREEGEYYYSS